MVVKRIDLPAKDLSTIASRVSGHGGVAFLLSKNGERAEAIITSGIPQVNAGEIIGQISTMLGGKGGGNASLARGGGGNTDQIELALKVGRERIAASIQG